MNNARYIKLENVTTNPKLSGGLALDHFNLNLAKGEWLQVRGPSGIGKSGFLLLMAGLVRPHCGTIICNNQEVKGPSSDRALVPQWDALLPWLTCYQNVFLAVERAHARKKPRSELHIDTALALQLMRLSGVQHQRPGKLDADQRQRVSIARALAVKPQVLLLDAPFASLSQDSMAWLPNVLHQHTQDLALTTIMTSNNLATAHTEPVTVLDLQHCARAPAPSSCPNKKPPGVTAGRLEQNTGIRPCDVVTP